MKDSASDKNKTKSNEEDLSLAELLGTGPDDAVAQTPRRSSEGRSDEPSSGMVRLSAMIASASVEAAKTPSVIPPPASARPEATPTGGVHYSAPPPPANASPMAAAPTAKSSGTGWIIAVVALAAVVIGAFALLRPSPVPSNNAELEQKIAQMQAELEAAKRAGTSDKASENALKAKIAELEAAKATAQQNAQASAEPAKEESKAAAEPAPRNTPVARPPRENKAEEKTTRSEDKATTSPAKTAAREKEEVSKTDKAEPTGGTKPAASDELDSLLGKKKEEPKAEPKKESAPASDALPSQPDRAAVQQAMSSVASKAQACSKYSTGTIQLKVTVGNDGKVKSSEALGAFAGTTAGKCVEMLARAAKFPKFSDPTFTVTYPITLK